MKSSTIMMAVLVFLALGTQSSYSDKCGSDAQKLKDVQKRAKPLSRLLLMDLGEPVHSSLSKLMEGLFKAPTGGKDQCEKYQKLLTGIDGALREMQSFGNQAWEDIDSSTIDTIREFVEYLNKNL